MVLGLACVLPAIGSASVLSFAISAVAGNGLTAYQNSTLGATSGTIDFNNAILQIDGVNSTNTNDTISETYSYNSATNSTTLVFATVQAITFGSNTITASTPFLTIVDTGNPVGPITTFQTYQLYSNVNGLTFSSPFAVALGLSATDLQPTPSVVNSSPVPQDSFTTNGASAVGSTDVGLTITTPEPSSMAMMGLAAFGLLFVSSRKKLSTKAIRG